MAQKKLYRSRENVILAGVCGGMAEYFHHDATWWRLGFVAFLIATGFMPGILIYAAAWVLIPLRPVTAFDYEQ